VSEVRSSRRRVRARVVVFMVASSLLVVVGACGGGGDGGSGDAATPPKPRGALADDAQVLMGRKVFGSYCSTCHGVSGGGGVGPTFNDGKLLKDFPDPKAQEAFVKAGKGAMPSFSSLGDARIEAVVRYEREVLSRKQP